MERRSEDREKTMLLQRFEDLQEKVDRDLRGMHDKILEIHGETVSSRESVNTTSRLVVDMQKQVGTLINVLTAVNGTKTLFGWLWDVSKGLAVIAGGCAVFWHWLLKDLAR